MSAAKTAAPQPRSTANASQSGGRQVVWTLVASAVAGLTAYYSTFSRQATSVSTLPGSYALCADGQRIYTVDSERPTVDCILIEKQNIAATGTLAEVQAFWDDYQNELIRKFYGNEPSAKKPLPVYNAPANAIIVPGLAGAHRDAIRA
ncbi:hypothetical protein NUW54_g4621 [Trametes sanguinea]|uniref:Uncharacterized protein n=1 Tax=Trametes sanguinea TaxID=158606 RepID=A0ACC1PZY6_9APHY|nr:hypothetical protein NUW54_g4621 [Trametes sanguinea]